MERPSKGRLDLLGAARREPPSAPEGERPDDEAWRADAFARSRHSRLGEPAAPTAAVGPAVAEALCATLTRQALGDLSPLLLLLGGERRRAQALAAYAFTLFDFARQRGVEGERLAQINRWQFTLEATLDGEVPAQPVFVAMAAEHRRRPWAPAPLDALAAAARKRVSEPLPRTRGELDARRSRLAAALGEALLGEPPAAAVAALGGALLVVPALVGVGEERRQKRSPLAAEDLAPESEAGEPSSPAGVAAAVAREAKRLEPLLLTPPAGLGALPKPYRRALAFARLAAIELLGHAAAAGPELLVAPPRLGLGARLRLLARARWGREAGSS